MYVLFAQSLSRNEQSLCAWDVLTMSTITIVSTSYRWECFALQLANKLILAKMKLF